MIAEFVSHAPSSLFPSPTSSLNLEVKETPDVPWDSLGQWQIASVGQYLDITDTLQAAIDKGKPTVYIPRGQYFLNGQVLVRGAVRRLIGCEARLIIRQGTQSSIKVVDGTSPTVVIERFDGEANNSAAMGAVVNTSSGIAEVLGGLYYTINDPLQTPMFVNSGSLSVVMTEIGWTNYHNNLVIETRDGTTDTLKRGELPIMHSGSRIALYTGYKAQPVASAPTASPSARRAARCHPWVTCTRPSGHAAFWGARVYTVHGQRLPTRVVAREKKGAEVMVVVP